MWESRVLCEISKSLWKPFCGFHRDVISIAVFVVFVVADAIETGIRGRLYPYPVSDRGSWRLLRGRRSRSVGRIAPRLVTGDVWSPRALVLADALAAVARAPAASAASDPCDSSGRRIPESPCGGRGDRSRPPCPSGRERSDPTD